jgi:hypothetical protein
MHLTSTLVLFLTFSVSLVSAAPASAAYSAVSVASDGIRLGLPRVILAGVAL